MTWIAVTSTSTRDAAPDAARKKRRRIEPRTSTTSPARSDRALRRARPLQTAQSSVSTDDLGRDRSTGLSTTTRKVQTESPLGSALSSAAADTRPTNRTSLTASIAA